MLGSRLGSYDIQALAGRGGMGEVYRARDSKLKRTVAIKILPSEFSQHPERLQRFQLEAEALAALNHPNIAAIHALEEDNQTTFLVLEFVEGDTLAERLTSGPIPMDEVMTFARQICSALAAAHDRGIIHRDLKPANIKLTPAGQVKLLDFGLAKAMDREGVGGQGLGVGDASQSPTITSPAMVTGAGVILGTAAYMSPEQARGKTVDKRADLWALGCVLYEMVTAKPVFAGETVTDVLAAVVTQTPDLAALPDNTPAQLRWVIERCLQKDASTRLRDAGDAELALAFPMQAQAVATTSASARGAYWVAAAGAALALIATAVGFALWRSPVPPAPLTRFDIPVPGAAPTQTIAVSPDGRQIVYAAEAGVAQIQLWLRSLDAPEAKAVPGTEAPRTTSMSPAWSPDGRSIAFAADDKLKTIDVSSGSSQTLVTLDAGVGGITWNKDDVILFASNNHGLRRVAASGGAVSDVTTRDPSLDETFHDCPQFLPDGRHFIYLAYSTGKPENRAVYVGDLESSTRTRVVASDACVAYADPGFLVMPRGQTLVARPFDAAAMQVTGDPVQIVDSVATFSNGEIAAFAVAGNAALVYRRPQPAANRTLVWMDRSGKTIPLASDAATSRTGRENMVKLSPDNKRIAYSAGADGAADDIWTRDLERNLRLRLTTNPSVDHVPIWSPDGTRVLFDSHRSGEGSELYEIPSSGATEEKLVLKPEGSKDFIAAADWSRDGSTVLFHRARTGGPPWAIWAFPFTGDRKPFLYKQSAADNVGAKLSPSGRFVAYSTNESGTYQVVVQPFPDPSSGKWQVSDAGGALPIWRADGRELFYLAPSGDLMAVSVTTDPTFAIGTTTKLFRAPLTFTTQGAPYDVAVDGQRFLIAAVSGDATPSPISTILNWTALATKTP